MLKVRIKNTSCESHEDMTKVYIIVDKNPLGYLVKQVTSNALKPTRIVQKNEVVYL